MELMVYPILAKESSVANPQKVAKIDKKTRKVFTKFSWQHCFILQQPMNYPNPRVTLVTLSSIDYHRLPSATIGYRQLPLATINYHRLVSVSIVGIPNANLCIKSV
jgi:hypothetical protein